MVNSVLRGNDFTYSSPEYAVNNCVIIGFMRKSRRKSRVNDDAAPSQAPVGVSTHHRTSNSQRNRQLNAAQKLGGEAYGGASADLQPSEEGLSMADYFGRSLARQLDEESQTSTSPATDQDSPFVEADHDLTKLKGETTTEKFDTLIDVRNPDILSKL